MFPFVWMPKRFMVTGGDELLANHRNLNFAFQFSADVFSVRVD
jgi:hypothetical protein